MPQSPTAEQITQAREYILRRISDQRMLEEQLEFAFDEAAVRIAQIVLKYNSRNFTLRFTGNSQMAKEIQQVIDWLEEQIDYYVDYYAVPEEASDDPEQELMVITRIHEPDHGYTYEDRKTLYLSNYIKGLAVYDFYDMFDEDEIIEAINEATEKPHNRMNLLALNMVAMGYMFYASQNAAERGAVGFYVYPGSSNPCRFCIDQHYVFHTMDDTPPPYHPNCCCVVVYVNAN